MATVFTAKTIGTFTVGLWAGYNASLIRGDTPLNTAISDTFNVFLERTGLAAKGRPEDCTCRKIPLSAATMKELVLRAIHLSVLPGIVSAAHAVSYLVARSSGRHPYLLYLALGAPLVGSLQFMGGRELLAQIKKPESLGEESKAGEEPSDLSESVYEHIPSAKETVYVEDEKRHTAIQDKYAIYSHVVSGLSAALFLINVIGVAGESSASV